MKGRRWSEGISLRFIKLHRLADACSASWLLTFNGISFAPQSSHLPSGSEHFNLTGVHVWVGFRYRPSWRFERKLSTGCVVAYNFHLKTRNIHITKRVQQRNRDWHRGPLGKACQWSTNIEQETRTHPHTLNLIEKCSNRRFMFWWCHLGWWWSVRDLNAKVSGHKTMGTN